MHYFKFFTKLQITKFTNNENLKILTNFAAWKSKKDIRSFQKQLRDFVNIMTKPFEEIKYMNGCGAKAHSFEDMTNVSKQTDYAGKHFVINHIKVDTMQRSEDGTVKNAVRLHDGLVVESVLIPTNTQNYSLCF
jgi:23S rRNA (adenine2503-C2)-methyltransferase